MGVVYSFQRAATKAAPQDDVANIRSTIAAARDTVRSFAFEDPAEHDFFTAPDYDGAILKVLAKRIANVDVNGPERTGYVAMLSAAYLTSQRLHRLSFWLDDYERHAAEKDDALLPRLADENFIAFAEQALLTNARMHPNSLQAVYKALSTSAEAVDRARRLQASLPPVPAAQPDAGQAPAPV